MADMLVTGQCARVAVLLVVLGSVLLVADHRTAELGVPLARVTVGLEPDALALDARHDRVYVANSGAATVSVLDARRAVVLATTAVDGGPSALGVDPLSGHVFVLCTTVASSDGRDRVDMLDAGGRLLRVVAVGPGARALGVDGRTGRVFVANERANSVSLLDARSGAVLRTIPVGPSPGTVVVDASTDRAFVVNAGTRDNGFLESPGSVSVVEAHSGAILRTVMTGYGAGAGAVDERRHRAVVVNSSDNTISVLETHTGRVLHTISVGPRPSSVAVDERTGQVVVLTQGDGSVRMVDTARGRGWRTVLIGVNPVAVAVAERTHTVWVLNAPGLENRDMGIQRGVSQVAILDGHTGHLLRTVQLGGGAPALALDERTSRAFVATIASPRGGTSAVALLTAWGRHWLPWLPRSPQPQSPLTGYVTVLDTRRR